MADQAIAPMLDERTIECIVNRLTLCESPKSIASSYGIAEKVVLDVRRHSQGKILQLQRCWQDWVSGIEPLAADVNRILFLGAVARRAFASDRLNDAKGAVEAIEKIFTRRKDQESSLIDASIIDQFNQGDWETGLSNMAEEEARQRESGSPALPDIVNINMIGENGHTTKYHKDPTHEAADKVLAIARQELPAEPKKPSPARNKAGKLRRRSKTAAQKKLDARERRIEAYRVKRATKAAKAAEAEFVPFPEDA